MVIGITKNHSRRSTPQPNKILDNTNPSARAIHLAIVGLSGLNKWIRPFINANNNTANTSANTHIQLFLIIREYMYILYRSQTFLGKERFRELEIMGKRASLGIGVWVWGGGGGGGDGQTMGR